LKKPARATIRGALLVASALAAAACGPSRPAAQDAATPPTAPPAIEAAAPALPGTAAPAPPMATPGSRSVYVGNTNGAGVYVRGSRAREDRIRAYPDGTVFQVIGLDLEGRGETWLPVRAPDGLEGWLPRVFTTDAPPTSVPTSPPPTVPLPALRATPAGAPPEGIAATPAVPTSPPPALIVPPVVPTLPLLAPTVMPRGQQPPPAPTPPPQVPTPRGAPPPAAPGRLIEAHIDGEFTGWDGETLFHLSNGQYWQQAAYDYTYHYAYSPRVVIAITPSGGLMQVEGVSGTVQVKEITPAVIESQIRGNFEGWTGSTIFPLQNGQVWQQASYTYHYHYAYSPRVVI
jgi:hypothetical protein